MKIGILTQPLHCNYGGMLQAYALQQVLKRMGHEPWLVRRIGRIARPPLQQGMADVAKALLGRKPAYRTFLEREYVEHRVRPFRDKYIAPVTPLLYTTDQLAERTLRDGYEALLVGSDQVWRPKYSPCITNYFLDFAEGRAVRRVAYGASFGVDEWEFSREDTARCARLLRQFDAVSVRESSGIGLCRERLGCEAVQVLDPTLLLDKSDYEKIVEREEEPACGGSLFCYVLDSEPAKSRALEVLASRTGLSPFMSMPRKPATAENLLTDPEACVYPPVTRWLRSFMDARLVLTDSFHGCVFSILFNKPFWVIGNRARGMARFESLLGMFGLGERLVTPEQLEAVDPLSPVDWASVNARRETMRAFSMSFLTNSLQ